MSLNAIICISQAYLIFVMESVFFWHIGSGDVTSHGSFLRALDPLTLTATQCQKMLAAGTTSTLELVEVFLNQIRQHNHDGIKLNAVISTAPIEVLTQQAKRLDEERANGKVTGPLHGVLIIIKDSILTDSDLGMDTTYGSFALVGAKAKNALVVNAISKACMIILGKANLSVLYIPSHL
jgi:amidase